VGVSVGDAKLSGSNTFGQTDGEYANDANGLNSAAFGIHSTAHGSSSTAFGADTTANGDRSVAFGIGSIANGDNSAAFGDHATAEPQSSFVIGKYNIITGNENEWVNNEPLFIIGNGANIENRNNAVTVLKNGNVGIGIATPGYKLHILGSDSTDAEIFLRPGNWNNAGDYGQITFGNNEHYIRGEYHNGMTFYDSNQFLFDGGNVGIGSTDATKKLFVSGTAGGTSAWDSSSSLKWKTAITPLDNILDKVTQIQGVTYQWRVDEFPEMSFENTTQIGIIAEELEKVFPELVNTDQNGDKSIQYGKLTPILIEAIKEQQKVNESQQLVLEELKTVICPNYPELNACQ